MSVRLSRAALVSAVAACLAAAPSAAADEPAPAPAAPPAAATSPAPSADPAIPDSTAAPATTTTAAAPAAQVVATTAAPRRWLLGDWLIGAYISGGVEQMLRPRSSDPSTRFVCSKVTATCDVAAFGVGGQILWRGLLGPALSLHASAGSPLVPEGGSATMPGTTQGLADRISVAPALAVRPLGWLAWRRGDDWVSRLLGGLSLEFGPSIDYSRTGSVPLPSCEIPATAVKLGLHTMASLEVPLLGSARSGWVSLRAAVRVLAGSDTPLAPNRPNGAGNDTPCSPQITEPGVAAQYQIGFAYSL